MTDLHYAIQNAYKNARNRNWDKIYVLLDVHGTIASSTYSSDQMELYPDAVAALRVLCSFPEVRIILWTSCYEKEIVKWCTILASKGITVSAVNRSLEKNSRTGNFSKKPYFSVLIDDKAGFRPSQWPEVVFSFSISRVEHPLVKS